MPTYLVTSPEYVVGGNCLDDDPPEHVCSIAFVDAPNKRQAKVAAVQKWRDENDRWVRDDDNPFTGLKVERLEDCPECGRNPGRESDWASYVGPGDCATCNPESLMETLDAQA